MNKRIKAGISLVIAVFLTCAVVLRADLIAQAEDTDLRVAYKIISNNAAPTISRGSNFEADFYFYGNDYNEIKSIYVTSPNNSITGLSKESYSDTELSSGYDSDIDPAQFESGNFAKLNIPEINLRYVGKGPAILKFKVVFDDNSTISLQKTITECQVTSTSSGSDKSDLSLQSYSLDRTGIKEGGRFNLNLVLKNNSDIPNNHVTAVLDGLNSDEITVDGQMDTKTVGVVEAGETSDISFPMICYPKMVSKNYMLKIQLSSDESTVPASFNVFVPVTGTKADKDDTTSSSAGSSKPQIIIESYDYGGEAVTGGKDFVLTMNIKNTGTTVIENVKMTVSSSADTSSDTDTGGAFTPAKSSNTFFIAKLAGGAVIKEQIALLPKSDASPKSYGIGIAFKYEAVLDNKRESLDANETIAIPLTQPDRFEANDAELPGPMFLGQSGQLSINYVNKGKSKIFNLSVKLSGNFTTAETDSYIGNIESGVGDTFQATLDPSAEGTLTGTAIFSYEDANGATKTVTKDFSCEVTAQDPGGEVSSQPTEPTKAGNSPSLWMLSVGAAAVLAVIAALIVIRKKRKSKKLRLLEQSDDYDDFPVNEEKKQ
jgi:hypothetical protein